VVLDAMAAALTRLGFEPWGENEEAEAVDSDDESSRRLSCQPYWATSGAWLIMRMSRGLARGFAVELAARSGQPATLLHAHVRFREGADPACLYDGYEITVDARGRFGLLRPSVLESVSFSKEDLNTDKPWRIAERVLDIGLDRLVPQGPARAAWVWRGPEPLTDPRLERLAQALRGGAAYERVEIAGRRALRVREIDGAVSTSFLTESEVSAVLAAHRR
jgi:hypothetical protein